ncbi:MAG: 3-oxoacid CoA-transferase subunit B [Deltaproteobacteria bacterium]|nr:3-oxoacid CoA-transferase subunit B [Deltaproteobacteria bacterium]MBW2041109.1 3-oxoacid CoA-transferase subunit B [Deltaproteobacteria bacterium]MBW2132257.1 3-oxoacid CoA-transferase subunit B [Deltaproteobacteria bacterium]
MSYKEKIARRAAAEIAPGQVVNLGIGIPTIIPRFIEPDFPVVVQSENGILGMGLPTVRGLEDRNLIDAGGSYVSILPGASFFDSALSFALIRGGRLDIAFLGALEVSETGDLANWIIPGKYAPGIGGGMELAQKARRVVVTTTHTTRDGRPKILRECTLPLTAKACVHTIITELAVMAVTPSGLVLRELAEEIGVQEVLEKTGVPLTVPKGTIPVF